jgi:hypothetical protein
MYCIVIYPLVVVPKICRDRAMTRICGLAKLAGLYSMERAYIEVHHMYHSDS